MDPPNPVPRSRFTDLELLSLSLHLGGFTGQILGWGFIEPRWWRNYLHVHSFFEVCYAFQGRGIFQISNVEHRVQAGDLFVARPGEPHEIISDDDEPLGIYFWSYTLVPVPDRPHDTTGMNALLSAFLSSGEYVSAKTLAMQRTLDLLTEEIVQKEPGYAHVIEGLAAKLILDTARSVAEVYVPPEPLAVPTRSQTDVVVQRVISYLRDNVSRSISLRDIAAQVHLSERHTNRLFHGVVGVSIMEYLACIRMDTAAQLLLNRELAIKEVARMAGYPDVRYFTTLFHRRMGVTPAAFRRRGGTQFLSS